MISFLASGVSAATPNEDRPSFFPNNQVLENFCFRAWLAVERNSPSQSMKTQQVDVARKTLGSFLIEKGLASGVNRAVVSVNNAAHTPEQAHVSKRTLRRLAGLNHHLLRGGVHHVALVLKGDHIDEFLGRWWEVMKAEQESEAIAPINQEIFLASVSSFFNSLPVMGFFAVAVANMYFSPPEHVLAYMALGATALTSSGIVAWDTYDTFRSLISFDDFRALITAGVSGDGFTHLGWSIRIEKDFAEQLATTGILHPETHNTIAAQGGRSIIATIHDKIVQYPDADKTFVHFDVLAFRDAAGEPVLAWYIRVTPDRTNVPKPRRAQKPRVGLPSLQQVLQHWFPQPIPIRVPERGG